MKYKETNPAQINTSSYLAYVIYTSGTTGKPKGVMIEHKGVVSLKYSLTEKYQLGHKNQPEVILQFANYVFDPSVEQFVLALLNGYTLLLVPNKLWLECGKFYDYLNRHKVTHIHATPSFLEQYNFSKIQSVIRIISGGEVLTKECYNKLLLGYQNIVNEYGPTETTITAMVEMIHDEGFTIGRPVGNTTAYILDNNLIPRPIGAIGELYIGGGSLARGYLNLSELTKEKFINNPFQTKQDKRLNKNDRLYQTGDLVRYLSDGRIEYICRNDFQVKIRGYRIELGEIESKLSSYPKVKQSVVLAHGHNGNEYLVGYYVSDKKLNEEEIFKYLNSNLPEYMVPNSLIWVDKLPLTFNGKLDRQSLPRPELTDTTSYVAPSNEIENQLCKILSIVLNLDINKISVNDDFFKLGGNSISLISLTNKINNLYKIDLPVSQLFFNRTISKISNQIQNLQIKIFDNNSIIIKANIQQQFPIVFIHPGHSGAEVYLDLISKLPDQIPCYVIDSYNLYHLSTPIITIEEMAKYYINLLDQNNIKGPYQLVGWSLGGIIAAEITKQLIIRGDQVFHLHLLDSFIHFNNESRKLAKNCQNAMKNFIFNQNHLTQFSDNQIKTFEIESNAMINYNFQNILNINTTLYKAESKIYNKKMSPELAEYINFLHPLKDNGWGKFIPILKKISLNSDHYQILAGTSLTTIIESISSTWEKYASTDN